MSDDLVRGARGYVRNRTEEPHVRPCETNMGHPEQKRIQDRGETAAARRLLYLTAVLSHDKEEYVAENPDRGKHFDDEELFVTINRTTYYSTPE
jgi:hypothetical protein